MGWCVMVDGENTCCSNLCLAPAYLLTPAPLPPLPLHTESQRSQLPTIHIVTLQHLTYLLGNVKWGRGTRSLTHYSLFKNLLKIFREQILNFEFWRKCSHKMTKFLEEYAPMGDKNCQAAAGLDFLFLLKSFIDWAESSQYKQTVSSSDRNVLVGMK